jgi:beta-lactam-binding protein with PASTA domain
VIATKLPSAKRKIKARHCKVGRVRRVRVRSRLVARVVGQSPRAGTVRKRGFRVKLTVGRRR